MFTARFDAFLPQLAEYLSCAVYSVAFKKNVLYLSAQLSVHLPPGILAAFEPLIITLTTDIEKGACL
jgi:hypothetical protein